MQIGYDLAGPYTMKIVWDWSGLMNQFDTSPMWITIAGITHRPYIESISECSFSMCCGKGDQSLVPKFKEKFKCYRLRKVTTGKYNQ